MMNVDNAIGIRVNGPEQLKAIMRHFEDTVPYRHFNPMPEDVNSLWYVLGKWYYEESDYYVNEGDILVSTLEEFELELVKVRLCGSES